MNARPIVIDTAPGIDNAIALALLTADHNLDVKLVGSVAAGHAELTAAQSLMKVLTFLHRRTLVAQGCVKPLVRSQYLANGVWQPADCDLIPCPNSSLSHLAGSNAVLEERRVLLESIQPVTLVTLGPLTNIALLLATFPEVKSHIEQIIMMVGSTERGNATVYGEFNAVCDPEAAGIVFRSGLPLVMAGLDIGRQISLNEQDLRQMKSAGRVGSMISSLLEPSNDRPAGTIELCGTSAAMYLLEPGLFTTRRARVDVETEGSLTLGATVANFNLAKPSGHTANSSSSELEANVTVCVDVDVCGLKASFLDRVAQADAAEAR
ncbi:ribonucleoside hydrolase RihC [Bombiscardovia nodaiensis]|uniref:Ribonucleoside hydrolase RihC n=1 Tax=Bombiscardovia nodaiensis TaxID=2932181 RepID=A0ABM8B5Y3_9BIFI|nr:ribonucleoside hydrolase RihC [Bombiscardovia nodaiensis]